MKKEKLKLLLNYPTSSNTLKERLELLLPKKKTNPKAQKIQKTKNTQKNIKNTNVIKNTKKRKIKSV